MYDRILIPTDGTTVAERGVEHGIELAKALGSEIHALFVIKDAGNPWESAPMEDQQDRAREHADKITDEVAEMAAAAGLECVTAAEISPHVFEEINDYAVENDIDAIVIGSGYKGRVGGLLGGVSERVIRTADVPVTVVKTQELD